MSDILLVGHAPSADAGKEYFLHCMDWWVDIVSAIEELADESYPFHEVFYRDHFLAPMSPHLNGAQACRLAEFLTERRDEGDLNQVLDRILTEYIDEDDEEREEILEDRICERMAQIDEFIEFLQACGGCQAQWYTDA